MTLRIVTSTGSSDFITGRIDFKKNYLAQIGVANPWFASSRETQHFFWLLWHTAIFDERGILKQRDSKEPAVDSLVRNGW